MTACSTSNSSRSSKNNAGPMRVETDETGRRVELPQHPERIISLAPSVTEVLFMLGAGSRVIGVTTQCNWPAEALRKPRIGDLINPNYELILAARPDLIVASTAGNDRAAIFKLADLGLPVYVTAPRTAAKILDTVRSTGRIVDCAPRAELLVSEMKSRIADVQHRLAGLPPIRAFFVTWFDPLLAPGRYTFENDVLKEAGVESISSSVEEFYPRYSLEQVVRQDPDAIITVEHAGHNLPDLKTTPGWQNLRAVREGKVYILNEVFQHPSPRFVEGIEELARKLHPERFR